MYRDQPQTTRQGVPKAPRDFHANMVSSPDGKIAYAQAALKSQQNMDYDYSNQKLTNEGAGMKARVPPITQRKLNANRYSVDAANPTQRGLYSDTKRSSLAMGYENSQAGMLPHVGGKVGKIGDSSYLPSPAMDLSHDTLASGPQRLQQQRRNQLKMGTIQSTAEAHSRAMHQD